MLDLQSVAVAPQNCLLWEKKKKKLWEYNCLISSWYLILVTAPPGYPDCRGFKAKFRCIMVNCSNGKWASCPFSKNNKMQPILSQMWPRCKLYIISCLSHQTRVLSHPTVVWDTDEEVTMYFGHSPNNSANRPQLFYHIHPALWDSDCPWSWNSPSTMASGVSWPWGSADLKLPSAQAKYTPRQ